MIGAEILSRHLDHDDRKTAALFGDGAGAVVLGAGATPAASAPSCSAPTAPPRRSSAPTARPGIIADGRPRDVQARGRDAWPLDAARPSRRAGLTLDDIDLFVFHQANGRILTAVAERSASTASASST